MKKKDEDDDSRSWKLYVDGACPGNPGPGGAGIVIKDSEDVPIYEECSFVGENTTNNVAEYTAMSIGLKRCLDRSITNLEVMTDSRLMVGQLGFLGKAPWRVNSPNLVSLHAECMTQLRRFKRVEVRWIPRESNADADRVANLAVRIRESRVVLDTI